MEPQIIDYYNELPQGLNIIDKLNEEYDELQNKYDYIKWFNSGYIAPILIVSTIQDYIKYREYFDFKFPKKVEGILNDKEKGVPAVFEKVIRNLYFYLEELESCIDKIIDELNDITNKKNKTWCENRVNIGFQICLRKYDGFIGPINIKKIIIEITRYISCNNHLIFLPPFYEKTINFFTNEEYESHLEFINLSDLVCYRCEKCKKLCNCLDYHRDELLLCDICNPYYGL